MLTRRDFVKAGMVAGASLALPFGPLMQGRAFGQPTAPPLTPYVDPLPVPPFKSLANGGGYDYADVFARVLQHSHHSELPATTMWGYDGFYPGPTVVATRNREIRLRFFNQLPAGNHPFNAAFDPTIFGVDDGRMAVHLHGGDVQSDSDGNPMDFFLPGQDKTYFYPNQQRGSTIWYHDHAVGNTRLNVMAGMAAFYLIIDPTEEAAITANNPGAGLPFLPYLFGMAIQDRDFNADGSIFYPTEGINPDIHPHWIPEYFANTMCVNGKAWPYLDVEPRKYRFKLVNGAQARFFNLSLSNGRPITVLGSDGGYLAAPVEVQSLLFAPGERYDIVIDFAGLPADTRIEVTNDAAAPYPDGDVPTGDSTKVMQFRVTRPLDTSVPDLPLPATLANVPAVTVPAGAKTRSLFLNEVMGANGPTAVLLNNAHYMEPMPGMPEMPMPVAATERVRVGSTEVWEIANTTGDTHPIHLHLVQYRLLNRQGFRAAAYKRLAMASPKPPSVKTFLNAAPPTGPHPQEASWKDTVLMHPGEVTRILVKFAPQDAVATPGVNSYPFDPTSGPGYVWHCHILEHEENDMMRPLIITS